MLFSLFLFLSITARFSLNHWILTNKKKSFLVKFWNKNTQFSFLLRQKKIFFSSQIFALTKKQLNCKKEVFYRIYCITLLPFKLINCNSFFISLLCLFPKNNNIQKPSKTHTIRHNSSKCKLRLQDSNSDWLCVVKNNYEKIK